MDAIVGFSSLRYQPPPTNRNDRNTAWLYHDSYRRLVPITLALILIYNVVLLLCTGATVAYLALQLYNDDQVQTHRVVLVFLYCVVPVVTIIGSFVEIVKQRRFTLTPLRAIIISILGILLWALAFALWFWSAYWWNVPDTVLQQPGTVNVAIVMPWLILPAWLLLIGYLTLGAMGVHRQRRRPQAASPAPAPSYEMMRMNSSEVFVPVATSRERVQPALPENPFRSRPPSYHE